MLQNDVGTCGWLVDELVTARIVERDRLQPHLDEFTAESPYADADAFAKHLARQGVLTKLQAKRASDGEAKKLVLGAYVLTDMIGNGSLGPVYRAHGRADRKIYAVKVLPRRAWNVRLARQQVREFGELVEHDSVVPFLDVGTAHQSHYLVWPFAEGRTLETLVRECGSLSSGEAAQMGVQIAEALKHCHARRLIHGLIKPSNVMIDGDGLARLLDYGIGSLLAENAEDDEMLDTVARAESLAHLLECGAPESIADSSNWTAAGDQYSLGCTLYFAATGRLPFPGGTFVEKIIHHQSHQPTPIRSLNPDVSHGLADAIDRLMQKLPADRYGRFDDLIGDLMPLATVSCLRPPVPINLETPPPKGWLQLSKPNERGSGEQPTIDLSEAQRRRSWWKRLFG